MYKDTTGTRLSAKGKIRNRFYEVLSCVIDHPVRERKIRLQSKESSTNADYNIKNRN